MENKACKEKFNNGGWENSIYTMRNNNYHHHTNLNLGRES